jgi:alkanesulfonate monooxygenase SsuD/methylene tetrahydromethanopterin reductase-like flavin-dependent oxidoreductase (luciferase family)
MPYYLYRISQLGPVKQLEKISQFDVFRDASAEAKRLRRDGDLPAGVTVKVILAENELQAEDLLQQVREPEPLVGDDY